MVSSAFLPRCRALQVWTLRGVNLSDVSLANELASSDTALDGTEVMDSFVNARPNMIDDLERPEELQLENPGVEASGSGGDASIPGMGQLVAAYAPQGSASNAGSQGLEPWEPQQVIRVGTQSHAPEGVPSGAR